MCSSNSIGESGQFCSVFPLCDDVRSFRSQTTAAHIVEPHDKTAIKRKNLLEGPARPPDRQTLNLSHSSSQRDCILVELVIQRDPWALKVLYDLYSSQVFSLGCCILGDQDKAEDLLHEVFLQLWRGVQQYDETRTNFVVWLTETTRRLALNLRTRQNRAQSADTLFAAHGCNKMSSILGDLPEGEREMLELAYFGGLTCEQIAVRTGEPISSVKSRIRLALQKTRRLRAKRRQEERGRPSGGAGRHGWEESYKGAVLETDWTKMPDRIEKASLEINHRQYLFSRTDRGDLGEVQALLNAKKSLTVLKTDVAFWQTTQDSGSRVERDHTLRSGVND